MTKPKLIRGICEFCGIPGTECIHHSGEYANSYKLPMIDLFKSEEKIPKIIYSTWISDKPLPEKFLKYIESWQRVMPDYKIEIISINNYPKSAFIEKCIERKMFVVAGHYARVQRIYETGGIYFDIDVEAVQTFDRFLDDKLFVGFEDDQVVNNAVFGGVAGHPFLKANMDLLDSFDLDSANVELETGIRMFAKLFGGNDWGDLVTAYPPKYFYPYAWDQEFSPDCITEDTYAVHHWAHSWNGQVSVIIPCYKQEEYLDDAIKSALDQTVQPLEVIVVNDGSPTWNSWKNTWPSRSVKIINQENKGVSAARNTGIMKAKGKYIITLDADDKIHPDFIKKTIGVDDVVSTTLVTFGTENRHWDPTMDHPAFEDFVVNNQINCCSMFRKEMWEAVGGYDEEMIYGYEDWDLWTRMAQAGYTFTVVREPLFLYRKHGWSMVDDAKEKDAEIREYMANKYIKAYETQTKTQKTT